MTLTPITQLIIDRSKWRTGLHRENKTGVGITKLLNKDGFMCCIGMGCEQAGVERNLLFGVGYPQDLNVDVPLFSVGHKDTQLTEDAWLINDNEDTTPAEKELLLTERFAKEGIQVIFTGEYKNYGKQEKQKP